MLADYSAFLQEFRNWESAWAMKALHTVAYELRTIAEMVGAICLTRSSLTQCCSIDSICFCAFFVDAASSSIANLFFVLPRNTSVF